ncbi:MAG: hypothetical protein ACRC1M_04550, partial [Methanobacteriaceae archaeon]
MNNNTMNNNTNKGNNTKNNNGNNNTKNNTDNGNMDNKNTETEKIKELDSKYIIQTYGRQPIALSHGKGAKVWDAEGNEYLD